MIEVAVGDEKEVGFELCRGDGWFEETLEALLLLALVRQIGVDDHGEPVMGLHQVSGLPEPCARDGPLTNTHSSDARGESHAAQQYLDSHC